jgi:putative MFS transporter
MPASASAPTFAQIEQRPLNRKQKGLIAAAVLGTMLEFFDFFIVAFILTVIAEPWDLAFGQSAFLLLSAGFGAIVGSAVCGALADHVGRRKMFISTVLGGSLPASKILTIVRCFRWVWIS